MKAFQDFLKQFPYYSDEIFEELLPKLSIVELKTDEYFLKEGQTCNKLAFIEKGLVRIHYLNEGKEITKCFCREKNITCSYSVSAP
jgi:CRP-like cAMP-binding protein